MMSALKAALAYAQRLGWRVIPLHDVSSGACSCGDSKCERSAGKHPRISEWQKQATADRAAIEAWFSAFPAANVGLATGLQSGFFVLDVDGDEGRASLEGLVANHGDLPETLTATTGSGGTHYLFKAIAEVSNSAKKIAPGLDIRGDGGQIVVAPSISGRGSYQWNANPLRTPIAEPPAWLLELLQHHRAPRPVASITEERGYFPPASPAVIAAARAALERHGPAIEGNAGDEHTYVAAARLRHDFALTDEEAWPLLVEWNETCQPPWDEAELRTKLEGGEKYGTAAYGCRRTMDALATGKKWIEEWLATSTEPFELIRRARTLTFSEPAERAKLIEELASATGVKAKDLAMPAAVNMEALAEREARHAELERDGGNLIDPEAPLATARQFLAMTRDAEGAPALLRWQGEFWRAEASRYVERREELVVDDLYKFMERKRDVNTNGPIKPDRTVTEVLCHALRSAASFESPAAPAWVTARVGDVPADELIAFPNGLLHVPTRRFQPATRRFFNLNTVNFDYAPNAARPHGWFSFLSDLWGTDKEAIWTLQELFGLALTTDTSFQKLFMLIGPKRSGKGTIVRVLQGMVGGDNHCSPTLNGLGQHFGLESLIGKQLAVISDARLSGRADLGAIVENLLRISGEDTISVPRKHRGDWTAKLGARFLVVSNEVPGFIDQSGALASRFVVLQAQQSFFGREDRALTSKLLTELPGILNWAIYGLDRLRERGHFMQPSSALEALRQLEALASPIKAFVAERCMLGGSANAEQLFQAWRQWSQDQGREHPGTAAMFSRNLSAAFPEVKIMRAQADGSPAHAFVGVCLKESMF